MTNPTMPASDELSERMAALLGSTPWEKQPSVVAEQIRTARADERRKTLEEAAKDVCMYCGGRALGRSPAEGPNSAGNWVHSAPGQLSVLCSASSLHGRLAYEARALAKSSEPGEGKSKP